MSTHHHTPGLRILRVCSWIVIGFLLALLVLPWFLVIGLGKHL